VDCDNKNIAAVLFVPKYFDLSLGVGIFEIAAR
jgi:hypothetical protein